MTKASILLLISLAVILGVLVANFVSAAFRDINNAEPFEDRFMHEHINFTDFEHYFGFDEKENTKQAKPEIKMQAGHSITSANQEERSAIFTQDIPKTSRPNVELFVMSFCPFAIMEEEDIFPIIPLLNNSFNFSIRYIVQVNGDTINDVQALHGIDEAKQDAIQLIIARNYSNKFFDYLDRFNQECSPGQADSDEIDLCWKNISSGLGMNTAYIETAAYGPEGIALLRAGQAAAENYSIDASPTLVINGVEAQVGYYGTAEIKEEICSAYITQPQKCDKKFIASCTVINESGSYYLESNITSGKWKSCIRIEADNVLFDMQKNTITSRESDPYRTAAAIDIEYERSNISIINGKIINYSGGIEAEEILNLTLDGLQIYAKRYGLEIRDTENYLINNTKIESPIIYLAYNSGRIENSQLNTFIESYLEEEFCETSFSNVTGSRELPVYLYKDSNNLTIQNKLLDGLIICNVSNINLKGINLDSKPGRLDVISSSNILMENISITGGDSIQVANSNNITMDKINLTDTFFGIRLSYVNSALIRNINQKDVGIFSYLDNCNNITLENSEIESYGKKEEDSIPSFIIYDTYNLIINNTQISGGVYYEEGYNEERCSTTFNNVTTQDNKPIWFYKTNNSIIENIELGGLILCGNNNLRLNNISMNEKNNILNAAYTTNLTIENSNFNNSFILEVSDSKDIQIKSLLSKNTEHGIQIGDSKNAYLSDNTITGLNGISIYYTQNVTISQNKISDVICEGIGAYNPQNITIENNIILNTSAGITMNGEIVGKNYIRNNIIKNMIITNSSSQKLRTTGIEIDSYFREENKTGDIVISGNKIESNHGINIELNYWGLNENLSIYNNFINSTKGLFVDFYEWYDEESNSTPIILLNTTLTPGTSIANGPYMGGNYWANPNGAGYSQTCADSDNNYICDTPYPIVSSIEIYEFDEEEEEFEVKEINMTFTTDYLPLRLYTAPPPPPPPNNDTDDDDDDSGSRHHHSSSGSTTNDRIMLSTTPSQPTQSQENNNEKLSLTSESSKVKGSSLASMFSENTTLIVVLSLISIVFLIILLVILFI